MKLLKGNASLLLLIKHWYPWFQKKDKDNTDPSNNRPSGLLNLDCKILTKVLALHLQRVLNSFIDPNQTSFIKTRSSSDNIQKLLHIMWLSQSKDVPVAAFVLDGEKVFDEVEWQFFFSALSLFNFDLHFTKWVRTLYKDSKATVVTNGIISCGARQGCSLRPLLFLIFIALDRIKK